MTKKNISALMQAVGVVTSLAKKLIEEAYKAGATDEQIHSLVTPIGADKLRQIAAIIASNKGEAVQTTVAQEAKAVCEVVSTALDTASQLEVWKKIYQEEFGIELDITEEQLPMHQPGFNRLVVVAQGMTAQQVYDQCGKHFAMRRNLYDSLDEEVRENDRDAKTGAYAIWIRDRMAADDEWRGKSAKQLKKQEIQSMTLCERLLWGLLYWKMTGRHLDLNTSTLCAGSRFSDNRVPLVECDSNNDGLVVHWRGVNQGISWLRTREVVS